jgi:hypothetical protein
LKELESDHEPGLLFLLLLLLFFRRFNHRRVFGGIAIWYVDMAGQTPPSVAPANAALI